MPCPPVATGSHGRLVGEGDPTFRYLLFARRFRYDSRYMILEKPSVLSEPAPAVPSVTYWSGGHTKHRLLYHLVFVPKYRVRVLDGKVAERLRALFEQACEVNEWRIDELAVQPDHLHLMIQVYPHESVAQVVKTLKGGSSRVLRSEFPDLVEFLWSSSFWAEGYFAETVGQQWGQREETVVKRYIRRQREQRKAAPEA